MNGSLPELRVKICGLTREEDAARAVSLGAAFLGFVFAESPRRADPESLAAWLPGFRRSAPQVRTVGVFVRPVPASLPDLVARLALDLVQVHGDLGFVGGPGSESPFPVPWIRAVGPDELPEAGSHPAVLHRAVLRDDPEGRIRAEQEWAAGAPYAAGAPHAAGTPYAWLVDTPSRTKAGGTGETFDWSLLPPGPRAFRLFLAGGLSPANVAAAVRQVQPFAVDASSRLEAEAGRKDPAKLDTFFAALRDVADVVQAEGGVGR